MMTKQEIRKMIRLRKQQHSTDESSALTTVLKDNEHVSKAHTLLLYSALPDEVQTQALLDHLVEQGKTVLLPRVISDTEMELRRYTGRADLQQGAFNIMEPTGVLFTDYDAIEVAIVPGMAFDAEGHRLGRGKGFYDRFLPKIPHAYKIGLCFSWQLIDEVPHNTNDIMMDEVISRCKR
jgi:5-formyltetrahydrofolate cyclo-ligase